MAVPLGNAPGTEDGGGGLGGLRVLYVSALTPGYYGAFRLRALQRLPIEEVQALDLTQYAGGSGWWGKIEHRLQAGPRVHRLNREILRAARAMRANVAFFDKALGLQAKTLRALRRMGVISVDYVNDNPFGPRKDPGWRLFRRALPEYDLHAVPRASSVQDFQGRGARRVLQIRFTYEPTMHYPPCAAWADFSRTRMVSFVGTPYDDRARFLADLWRAGVPLNVSGSRPHWRAALPGDAFARVYCCGELIGDAYREAIWRSRINLSFVTRSNVDEVAHKSFEIAACGGFLLAERTPEHLACFKEDEEAVFFSSIEECRAKIDRYLPDERARTQIAQAGRKRAASSGYDNDSMLREVLGAAGKLLRAEAGAG